MHAWKPIEHIICDDSEKTAGHVLLECGGITVWISIIRGVNGEFAVTPSVKQNGEWKSAVYLGHNQRDVLKQTLDYFKSRVQTTGKVLKDVDEDIPF